MEKNEFPRFAQLMVQTAEIYNEKLSEIKIELYFEILKDFPYASIERAFVHHIRTSKFFPKPADIVEFIEGSPDDRSLKAWLLLTRLIKNYGYYYSIVVDDPALVATVEDMGGWMHICSTWKESELPYREREFREKYKYNLKHPQKSGNTLTGHLEAHARLNGYTPTSNYLVFANSKKQSLVKQEVSQDELG